VFAGTFRESRIVPCRMYVNRPWCFNGAWRRLFIGSLPWGSRNRKFSCARALRRFAVYGNGIIAAVAIDPCRTSSAPTLAALTIVKTSLLKSPENASPCVMCCMRCLFFFGNSSPTTLSILLMLS
jgi:hypothetical protein